MQTVHSRISKLKPDVKCIPSCPDRILFLVIVDAHRYSDKTWFKGLLRQWYGTSGKVTRILPPALQQVTDAHSHSWKRQTNGGVDFTTASCKHTLRVSTASDSLTLEEFISQDLVHICMATLIKNVREECVTQISQEAEAIGSPL